MFALDELDQMRDEMRRKKIIESTLYDRYHTMRICQLKSPEYEKRSFDHSDIDILDLPAKQTHRQRIHSFDPVIHINISPEKQFTLITQTIQQLNGTMKQLNDTITDALDKSILNDTKGDDNA